MNTFLKETSLRDMVVNDIFCSAIAKGNPFVKQEVFQWLAEKLPEGKSVAKDELASCLPSLFASIEDRSAEVRKASQEAVPGFMKHLGKAFHFSSFLVLSSTITQLQATSL